MPDAQVRYIKLPQLPRETLWRFKGIIPPRILYNPLLLYYLSLTCPDVNSIIFKHVNKVLRNRYSIEARFKLKCPVCGYESLETRQTECPQCGARMGEPDAAEKTKVSRFLERANPEGESFHSVLLQFLTALDTFDDAYLIIPKSYVAKDNEIVFERPEGVYASSPLFTRLVRDERGRLADIYFCPEHRSLALEEPGVCPQCGLELKRAVCAATSAPMAFGQGAEVYYSEDEVIHASFFNPSRFGGLSPLIPLYETVVTLIMMKRYIGSYYRFGRAPRGLFYAKSPNPDQLIKLWKEALTKLKEDPLWIPMLAVPTNVSREESSDLRYVSISPTLQELDYERVRNELRREIASYYGLSNLAINDLEGVGGLNSETQQLKLEDIQLSLLNNYLNEDILPQLCKKLGFQDWLIKVNPVEPEDMERKWSIKRSEAAYAQQLAEMGIRVTFTEDGNFEFEPGEVSVPGVGGEEAEEFELSNDDLDSIVNELLKEES
ncbi:MAG: hypothetical protein ACXQTM_00470 [Methanosarcinales archaeon]